jgi:excisionase family DNA binding protein
MSAALKDVQIFLIIANYYKVIYNTFKFVIFIYIIKESSMERLLTTEEVADLLRIEPVTVRRLIMRGELAAYRIAGEYRFAPTDVEQFLESQRVVVDIRAKNQFADKFTDQARKVLGVASEEARQYQHPSVGTEHVLLAILSEGEGIAVKALVQLQVQENEIRKQIETFHPAGSQPVGEGQIGMTAQGKQSIELAVQEARALGHHYIGTEHLLLGLLAEETEPGGQALRQSGVTLEKARRLVKQLLAEGQAAESSEEEQRGES